MDPQHPRADMKAELKAWCQQHHVEALAQLAVHDASREALLRDASVVPALQAVAETGLSEVARELAAAALTALSDKKLEVVTGGQKHVMLSYQWPSVGCTGTHASTTLEEGRVVEDSHMCVVFSRTENNQETERVPDCSRLRDLVRLDEYEGIDYGRNERCDRGS